MSVDTQPVSIDEGLTLAWRSGVPLPDICRVMQRRPFEVMDRVRALGLPDRHPTTREIEQPEYPLPMEPTPYLHAALVAAQREAVTHVLAVA